MSDIILVRRGMPKGPRQHFAWSEIDCHCNSSKCGSTLVSSRLLNNLELLRAKVATPLRLNCVYRCPEHNKAVGGAWHSQHPLGTAADVAYPAGIPKVEFLAAAKKLDFQGIGIYSTFLHLDMRVTGAAGWQG